MPTDEHLLPLIKNIGIADQLYWKPTHMGFIYGNARYPFNSAVDLLKFTPLSLVQRIRFGIASLLLRHLGKGLDLDNIKISDWLSKLYSQEVWENILKPLFCSKFGPHAGNLPALYIWQRLGREKNTAKRGYLQGGYKNLIDTLELKIKAAGGKIIKSSTVVKIQNQDKHIQINTAEKQPLHFDWAISTLPFPLLKKCITGTSLDGDFKDPQLTYQGVVNALFFISKPLDNFYWNPVVHSDTEFDGVVEMSELVDLSHYEGRHLIYVMKYCSPESSLFNQESETIAQRWTKQFLSLYKDLDLSNEDILEVQVFKAPYVEPIYPLAYLQNKPALRIGDSRLITASTAQIYPSITSCNSCVALAKDAISFIKGQDPSIH